MFILLLKSFLVASLFFWLTTPALAEYFQYTDQNGNVNFTDDVSVIPEDQRKDIIIFESVQRNDELGEPQNQQEPEPVDEENPSAAIPGTPTETDFQMAAEELEKVNTDLENASSALSTERETILKLKPEEGASSEEMVTYSEAIKALNVKIERYEQQRQEYDKKIQVYNEQIKTYNEQIKN